MMKLLLIRVLLGSVDVKRYANVQISLLTRRWCIISHMFEIYVDNLFISEKRPYRNALF